MTDISNEHWKTYLKRVLTRRCPRCGDESLFATRFRLNESCSNCNLVFRREQGAMTGQMYLSAVFTQILAALMVGVIFLGTDWSPLLSIAVSVPIIILFAYWVLPKSMALWVAIEFMTDIGNREPWVGNGE